MRWPEAAAVTAAWRGRGDAAGPVAAPAGAAGALRRGPHGPAEGGRWTGFARDARIAEPGRRAAGLGQGVGHRPHRFRPASVRRRPPVRARAGGGYAGPHLVGHRLAAPERRGRHARRWRTGGHVL
ncbi:hypothetical protein G6F46_014208 [Rhizopus delemar]|nr:hypothetical protein G6F46_014208 [Rhizopus delemar]